MLIELIDCPSCGRVAQQRDQTWVYCQHCGYDDRARDTGRVLLIGLVTLGLCVVGIWFLVAVTQWI